jgi:acetylornithine deacetylase/succinyl-diaminopimelate desuccinylase-like protein
MNPTPPPLVDCLSRAVDRERLLDTAVQLVGAPSRTGEAGAAADRLARLLTRDGFTVERPEAGYPAVPAVVVRLAGPGPGRDLLSELSRGTGVPVSAEFRFIRDAFHLPEDDPLTRAFQQAYTAVSGAPLRAGPKPFVDDGNSFYGMRRVPAITHGPRAGGQHTAHEWVEGDDLVRVAGLYALTAVLYCGGGAPA